MDWNRPSKYTYGKGRLRKVDLNQQQVSDFPGSEGLGAPRWEYGAQWVQVEVDHVPVWSRDGTTLYFVGLQNKIPGVYRVQPNQRTQRLVTDLTDFQFAGSMGTGMSLLPDDEPLLLPMLAGEHRDLCLVLGLAIARSSGIYSTDAFTIHGRNLNEICVPAWVVADRFVAGVMPETFSTSRKIVGRAGVRVGSVTSLEES